MGEMLALGVNVEQGIGSIIPIQATVFHIENGRSHPQDAYLSMVHATGNIEKIMDESRKVATTAIFHCADVLKIDLTRAGSPIHLHFMGGSTKKDGPSAGGAIALALASVLSGSIIRRDVSMTGEIDTQGRITAVGGIDVKIETACDAGCRTMIIPKESLEDEKGVKRLPQALKEELQILTYESWKGAHKPFDYRRHVLQVVAVDHVVQAADVTFIDQNEISSLANALSPHAESVAKPLAEIRQSDHRHLCVLYVKNPAELEMEGLEELRTEADSCVFLFPEKMAEAFKIRHPNLKGFKLTSDRERTTGQVQAAIQEIVAQSSAKLGSPIFVSIIAPFFFLQSEGITGKTRFTDETCAGLKVFANNFCLQKVKIKGCKAALNRVFQHLQYQEDADFENGSFLAKHQGIYVADLSFIPEKYRLDVKRSEEILNKCLHQWLNIVEGGEI